MHDCTLRTLQKVGLRVDTAASSWYEAKFVDINVEKPEKRSGYDHIFEDEELEEVPMASSKKTEFLEKEVLPDDTLQSIALEFNVSIADLKRANNIHKENEIFARKIIKIPHKPYSLLLESKFFRDNDPVEPVASTSNAAVREETSVIVDLVNNSTSTPLSPLSANSSPLEEAEETDVLLRTGAVTPDTTPLHCNGADGDMSWGFLLLVVICIGIGGPAAYIWFFWGHLEKSS